MKIAICLYGYVGTSQKYGQLTTCPTLSYDFLEKSILNINKNHSIDIFIHSWSHEYQELLIDLYHPVDSIFEPQIDFSKLFEDLNYTNTVKTRYFALFSKWYSVRKVLDLMTIHHQQKSYDLILLNRFDLCWKIPVDLNIFESSNIYCGYMPPNRRGICKLDDAYVIGNFNNILVVRKIYKFILGILNDKIKRVKKPHIFYLQSPHHALYRIFELKDLIKHIKYYFKQYEDYTPVRYLNNNITVDIKSPPT